MRCPYCGGDMVSGVVQSSRAFFFATEKHSILYWPNKSRGEFCLSSHNWASPVCAAYHCVNCKKVVLDYTQEVE